MSDGLSEEAVIQRLQRVAPGSDLVVDNGDDAVVVRLEGDAVLTTDDLVENVHFRLAWDDPFALGRKLVAVNASDLAAMGARPRYLLSNVILPDPTSMDWVDRFAEGLRSGCLRDGLALVGGKVSSSPGPVVLSATAVGTAAPNSVLQRKGAQRGQDIWVTVGPEGGLGAARAGFSLLEDPSLGASLGEDEVAHLTRAQKDPVPRVAFGQLLVSVATAGCDLSDGLTRDLLRVLGAAEGGAAGCVLDGEALPIPASVRAYARARDRDVASLALDGGEEYELLFTAPAERRKEIQALEAHGVRACRIGRVADGSPRARFPDGERLLEQGFSHFESKERRHSWR